MFATLGRLVALRTLSATLVSVVFFLAIIIVAEWQDAPRVAPASTKDVDLNEAFRDLKFIATGPHPYHSHRNDIVRNYILERVKGVEEVYDHVQVVDDLVSNATYSSITRTTYHESLNIIVAINGTAPNLDPVLISAHFDSVSTGGGATDDGMGVVTTMQLVQYFAKHPPRRTVIVFINNGEEDGLNGAQVFLEHPLSRGIKTFLNLEGAGSGGRPVLFRASNSGVAKHFAASPHPHGLAPFANAFKRGLIRSGTDYSVYEKAGMSGLDFAFYRQRDQYHTKYDSVSNLDGKAPLWSMLESSLETAKSLANAKGDSKGKSDFVYFDVLGEGFVVVTVQFAFIMNIIFLVLGPIFALVLGIFATRANKLYWTWHGWVRFPLALVLSVGLDIVLIYGFQEVNPYISYSASQATMLAFGSLTALVIYGVMAGFSHFLPIPSQRQITLIEYYVFWWIILVLDTIGLNKMKISVFFPVIFFHVGALLSLLVGLLEVLLFKPITPNADLPDDPDDPNVETALVVERAEPPPAGGGHSHNGNGAEEEGESDETTPLLVTRRKVIGLKSEIYNEKQAGGMWMWQYLVSVPFQALIVAQVAIATLAGLSGTLADGGSTILMLSLSAFFSFLIILPLAPFIHKLHFSLMIFITLLFIASTLYSFFAFPFSPSDPLKIYFKQTISLDSNLTQVNLQSVPMYLRHPVIDEIPSVVTSSDVECNSHGLRADLESCTYNGTMPAVAGPNSTLSELITHSAKLLHPSNARNNNTWVRFRVKGKDTRACRIYFNPSSALPIDVRVHGASHGGATQPGYPISSNGTDQIRLWSRTWDREWVVDADFGVLPSLNSSTSAGTKRKPIEGRIACEWAENLGDRIPALEEVETFLPKWAVVTKMDDGLVEAWWNFSVLDDGCHGGC